MQLLRELRYDENFLDNHVSPPEQKSFIEDLSLEITTVCKQSTSQVQSFYVVDDPSTLNFNCENFSKYPSLFKLLESVNNQYGCSLNSCVVNSYNAGQSRKHPHADDESYIDQSQPICTFTIGASRNILFFDNQTLSSGDSPQLALVQTLNPKEGSVYVMDPPFQSIYKHQVQSGSGKRMSVSFRKVFKAPVKHNEWPFNIMKSRVTNAPSLLESESSDKLLKPQLKLVLPEPPKVNRTSSAGDIVMSKKTAPPTIDEIDQLSKEDCKKLIVQLQARISKIEIEEYKLDDKEVDSLVLYEENPLTNAGVNVSELLPLVMKDITEITSESSKQDSISTHWILDNPSTTPFLVGKEMKTYPGISDLLAQIKSLDQDNEHLNACLLTRYPDGEAKSRLHSDGEVYICDESPICNFSIGEQRTIKFFNARLHSGPALKSIPMNSLSIVTMRPSCQQKLKHIVLPNRNAVGPRFCLSFRKVKPITEKNKVQEEASTEPPSTILIGTSVTKRINASKIVGKATCKFVNCSTSGDRIQDASDKLDKLYAGTLTDCDDKPVGTNLEIKNIILSVGTNDIRRKSNGVSSLYLPVRALLKKASDLFPNSQIYIQSVIPMGYEFSWTASNVMTFNSLLRRCAKEVPNCNYLDVFDDFIHRGYPIKSLFYDHLHPSARGAAVLARSFIAVTRGRNFSVKV